MTLESRLKWFLSVGLILNMVGFLAPAAVLPQILDDWQLSEKAGGWLAGAVFGGYAVSSPVLSALTDRFDAKRIMLMALVASALGGFGIAYVADGLWSAVVFRFISGFGLAGFYMPGLKLIADLLEGESRMRAAAVYPSMFALGGAGPFFIAAFLDDPADWPLIFAIAGLAAIIAFAVVAALVPGAPPKAAARRMNLRAALGNRGVQAYALAAAGHVMEIFSFRSWIVAALVFGVSLPINAAFADWNLALVAALTSLVTAPASVAFARLALKRDRRKVIAGISILSSAVAVAMAFAVHQTFPLFVALLFVYGITTFADTATLSGGIVAHADEDSRGTALAVFSVAGFSGGMMGPFIIGLLIEVAGGRQTPDAWTAAYLGLAGFAILPALVMRLFFRSLDRDR